ncbi:MAG: TetR/AcrR family transcriptional regulator [Bacteroidota bacterium]
MSARASVRHKVLDSAAELFYYQGYAATGIQQITDNAKVAKTSLYEHFRSKEDLCVAYLSKTREEWIGNLTDYCDVSNGSVEWTYRAFDFLAISGREEHFRGCSFLNILGEVPMDSEKIINEVSRTKAELRALFDKILSASSNKDLSDAIYVLFEGTMVEIQVQKDVWPVDASKLILDKLFQN